MNFNDAANVIRNYAANELGVKSNALPEAIEAIHDNFDDVRDDREVVVAYHVVMGGISALLG